MNIFWFCLFFSLTDRSFHLHWFWYWGELTEPCSVHGPHPEHVLLSCNQSMADEPAGQKITFMILNRCKSIYVKYQKSKRKKNIFFLPCSPNRLVVAWLPHIARHDAALNVVPNQVFCILGCLPAHHNGSVCVSSGNHFSCSRWDICKWEHFTWLDCCCSISFQCEYLELAGRQFKVFLPFQHLFYNMKEKIQSLVILAKSCMLLCLLTKLVAHCDGFSLLRRFTDTSRVAAADTK